VAEEAAPEVLVDAETNERLHDLGERLAAQKLTLEMFLQVTNQTPDELLATLRRDALRAVRVDLAMRALVSAEHLEATPEEIDEELERTAEAMGVSAERLRDNLRDSGRVVNFSAEVSKVKASKWLSENVVYVDPEGVEIDNAMLRVDQSLEGDDTTSDTADAADETDQADESVESDA
jgi:trigger factor